MRDDSELAAELEAAKNGSSRAVEKLITAWRPKLKAIAAKYGRGLAEADVEELEGDALIAFYDAIMTFDPGKDASFATYASVCARNRVITSVKTRRRQEPGVLVPLREDDDDDDAGVEDRGLLPDYISACEAESLKNKIRGLLSDYENSVFWRHVGGESTDAIAAAVGKPKKSVENALFRIRAKLRAALSEKNS